MQLYLVQHGEALAKEIDPDRSLSEQGKRDIEQVATFLKKSDNRIAQIFHSGKTRAKQSAEIFAEKLYCTASVESESGIKPNDDPKPFIDEVNSWEEDTLVVGHLPFMAKAASMLLTGNPEQASIGFLPGTLVCLERDSNGRWGLCWMIRPELFPG